MAMNQTDEAFRFTSYWIALEIIVGGKSDSIRSQLAKAYGEKKKSFADDHLFFKEISDVRHALMHEGRFGVLTSYQERLLQLYFWDIIIHQVGLDPRRLASALVESGIIGKEKQNFSEIRPEQL
jgi:hypothetical protein